MRKAANYRGSAFLVLAILLAGCTARKQPVYQNDRGFRFVPPPGWVERVRGEAMAVRAGHKHQDLPLPPLGVVGQPAERLLVRYDRISTGQHAWLRVTVAGLPSSTPLKALLSRRLPGRDWKRESEGASLEIGDLPAARIAFVGRWQAQNYLCETTAVRKGDEIYLFSASFPASDGTAREGTRRAIAAAVWQ